MNLIISFLFGFLFFVSASAQTIKIGSLQYGSVNWELKLIKELELDKKNNFDLLEAMYTAKIKIKDVRYE